MHRSLGPQFRAPVRAPARSASGNFSENKAAEAEKKTRVLDDTAHYIGKAQGGVPGFPPHLLFRGLEP